MSIPEKRLSSNRCGGQLVDDALCILAEFEWLLGGEHGMGLLFGVIELRLANRQRAFDLPHPLLILLLLVDELGDASRHLMHLGPPLLGHPHLILVVLGPIDAGPPEAPLLREGKKGRYELDGILRIVPQLPPGDGVASGIKLVGSGAGAILKVVHAINL